MAIAPHYFSKPSTNPIRFLGFNGLAYTLNQKPDPLCVLGWPGEDDAGNIIKFLPDNILLIVQVKNGRVTKEDVTEAKAFTMKYVSKAIQEQREKDLQALGQTAWENAKKQSGILPSQ